MVGESEETGGVINCQYLPDGDMVDQSDTNLEEILTFVILDLEQQEDQERDQVDAH